MGGWVGQLAVELEGQKTALMAQYSMVGGWVRRWLREGGAVVVTCSAAGPDVLPAALPPCSVCTHPLAHSFRNCTTCPAY